MRDLIKPIVIILVALLIGTIPISIFMQVPFIEVFVALLILLFLVIIAGVVFGLIMYASTLIFDYLEDRFG